jgi:hypothetical protein
MPTQYTPNSIATIEGFIYQQPDGPFGPDSYSIKSAGYSRIIFNQAPKLNPSEDFTVEGWYRYEDADFNGGIGLSQPVIFYDNSGGTNNFSLAGIVAAGTTTRIQLIVKDYNPTTTAVDTYTINSTADVLTVNTWHHVAVTRLGNTIKIYVDGIEVASLTTARPIFLHRSITFMLGINTGTGKTGRSSYANIRVSRSCKYTTTFSVPTGPYEYTTDAVVIYQAPYQEAERYITTLINGYGNETGDIAVATSYQNGLAMDSNRNIYIADASHHVIRKIDTSNNVTIFAGIAGVTGVLNTSIPTTSTFNTPVAVAVDSSDNVYVSDQGNRRIRRITQAGVVTTFCGTGTAGNTNGASTSSTFTTLGSLVIDSSNNVYVADNGGYRIRKITSAGVSSTLAGSTIGYTDSATSGSVKFNYMMRMAIYGTNLFVADYTNAAIRKVSLTNGATTTFNLALTPTSICINSTYGVMFVGTNKQIQMYELYNDGVDFTSPSLIASNPTSTTDGKDGALYSAKIDSIEDMICDRNNTDTIYIAHERSPAACLRKTYKNLQPLITQGSTELMLTGDDGVHGDNNNTIINYASIKDCAPFQYVASTTNVGPFGTNNTNTISFGGSSGEYFNYPGSLEVNLITGDFTIEFWYQSFTAGVMGRRILTVGSTNSANSLQLIQGNSANNGNFVSLFGGTGSTYWVNNTTKNINDGVWHHIAITRNGNNLRLYIDGNQIGATWTSAVNLTNSATQGMWLGATATNTTSTPFNFACLRLVKGIALYTNTTFNVPTTPPAEIAGTTVLPFKDYATGKTVTHTNVQIVNDTPFTNGSETTSLYLDGVSSAITTNGVDGSFNFSNEEFYIEGWFKLSSSNAADHIGLISCMNNETASTLRGWVINYDNINKILEFKCFQKGVERFTTAGGVINLTNDTWTHIAVARSSDIRIFVNGSIYTINPVATIVNSPYRLSIGEWDMDIAGRRRMKGNVAVVRVVRESSVNYFAFTASTTVPRFLYNYFGYTSLLYRSPYDTNCLHSLPALDLTIDKATSGQGPVNPFNATTTGSLYVDSNSEPFIGPSIPFSLGTGNFTIEFWIKPMLQSLAGNNRTYTILGQPGYRAPGIPMWRVELGYDPLFGMIQGISFAVSNGVSYTVALRTGNYLIANQWNHVVFQRSGTTWSSYINGKSQTLTAGSDYSTWSNSVDLSINQATMVYVGEASQTPYYLSDVRIVKGSVLYSGTTITVPTTPLTGSTTFRIGLGLKFNNSKIKDLSGTHNVITKNSKISDLQVKTGTGSIYFDGTDDFIIVPSMRGFNFGINDFTVEFWIYPLAYGTSTAGAQIFGTTYGSENGYSFNLGQNINSFRVIADAVDFNTSLNYGTWGNILTVSANGGPALNEWTHMAVVRDGANLTIYKNGVSVASTSLAKDWYFAGTDAMIGRYYDGNIIEDYNGYIDKLRVTRDRAIYTSNFIPPVRNYSSF